MLDFMPFWWYNIFMDKHEISVEKLYEIIQKQNIAIKELTQENEWFREQFKLLKRKNFGSSSEKVDTNQFNFFNEAEINIDLENPEPSLTEVKTHYRKARTRLITDKLPEDLPVEIVEHELQEQKCLCPECNNKLHVMGTDTREELKFIPPKAVIVRHVRNVYSCRNCENNSNHTPIVKADIPEPVIKGGFASPEAIAHIATQKFMMASPLYRQEQEWRQSGILISRQTMSNWLVKASERWLVAVYDELKAKLLEQKVLHADETRLQVLKEPGKKPQQVSYMWLYRTSGEAENQIVLYEYQPNRKHEHPKEFLKDFKGYLHTDGYDAYHKLPDDIVVVGCLAHLRRKFVDAFKALPKDRQKDSPAAKAVAYCDRLFDVEKTFARLSAIDRKKERDQVSKPLYDEFYNWLDTVNALPKSLLGKAVTYAKSQHKYLKNYLLDGRLEISNNRAERSIKPFVIGRKNWLFSNTPNGAKASAIYYSLIITAIENRLNPYEYLTWVLTNMPNLGKPGYASSIDDLLPGSKSLPQKVYTPTPRKKEAYEYAWEED